MPLFADVPSTDPEFADYGAVLEWLSHPTERGLRASHAIRGEDGVWIVDPIDVPGLDERLADLGDVAGVVVCTQAHARDAGAIASRHDVPVTMPVGLDRAAERVDAPVTWTDADHLDSRVALHVLEPLPGWIEAALAFDDALYVPEILGTAPQFCIDEERVGTSVFVRPVLPLAPLDRLAPARLFFGHGRAVTDDAAAAFEEVLSGARRRFPRAAVEHGPEQLGSIVRNIVLE